MPLGPRSTLLVRHNLCLLCYPAHRVCPILTSQSDKFNTIRHSTDQDKINMLMSRTTVKRQGLRGSLTKRICKVGVMYITNDILTEAISRKSDAQAPRPSSIIDHIAPGLSTYPTRHHFELASNRDANTYLSCSSQHVRLIAS